jgi:hypothetical protein
LNFTESQLLVSRQNLTKFVEAKALRYSQRFGVSYAPHGRAPETLLEIQQAYRHSLIHSTHFPIWDGASDNTIYLTPEANYAFRFWHDMLHLALFADTVVVDEIELGHIHVGCVMAEFGMYSLEAALMRADTIEQSKYCEEHGHFPVDQLRFAKERVKDM